MALTSRVEAALRWLRTLHPLERTLIAAGIPVINLTPVLTTARRRTRRSSPLRLLAGDIHWNRDGIAIGAAEIARHRAVDGAACASRRATRVLSAARY